MKLKPLIEKIIRAETLAEEEIARLAEFDPDAMETELSDTRNKLAELENAHSELCRRQQIEKISLSIGCNDPDYLDFRARRAGIDLQDTNAVKLFTDEISRHSPGIFRARIAPGSSAGTTAGAESSGKSSDISNYDRIGYITEQLHDVPDAK